MNPYSEGFKVGLTWVYDYTPAGPYAWAWGTVSRTIREVWLKGFEDGVWEQRRGIGYEFREVSRLSSRTVS